MPRLKSGCIPKYRRKKNRNVICGVVTLNGHDFYLPGPYDSKTSVNEYDRLIAEWLANGRQLPSDYEKADEKSIDELCVEYFKFAKGYYRKNGEETNEVNQFRVIIRLMRKLYGETPAKEFGPLRLKAIRETMIRNGSSRKHINKQVSRIRRLFKWGVEQEFIKGTIVADLQAVAPLKAGRCDAKETGPVQPVSDKIVADTLPHLPPIVADMVRIQRLTGMRPGEVCSLKPEDIDRTNSVWIYKPESHKTQHQGRSREIFIGAEAQSILKPYLFRDTSKFCFSPAETVELSRRERALNRETKSTYGNSKGFRRTSKTDKPRAGKSKRKPSEKYTTQSYGKAIHRACEKNGIEKWNLNQLRHTAATEIRKEFGLEAAQVILGHSKADVTQVYAEINREKGMEIASKIG